MAKQLDNRTKKFSVLFLVASIAGIVISASLLKEDVLSTAYTLTVFFPQAFGVTPAMTENGGVYLGIFISLAQIVGAAVAFAKQYSWSVRWMAFVVVFCAVPFDSWTDIVYRSGYLSGNLAVATITTVAFYTFGSEIMQTLSLTLFFSVWRQGLADILWGAVYGWSSLATMRKEAASFARAAKRFADRESASRVDEKNAYPAAAGNSLRPAPLRPAPRPSQHSLFGSQKPIYTPSHRELDSEIDEFGER